MQPGEGRAIHKGAIYATEQERPDVKAAREDWFANQDAFDPDALVFLDETAASTKIARRYGRAPRGRCRMAAPHGHYKTTTVTAALRTTGPTAVALFDGATNGDRFRAYVSDTLVPVLKPGNTVIFDNLRTHKVFGARGHRGGRWAAALPSVLRPRVQSVYGWLLRVKDVGSVWVNWSAAAMYTASDVRRDRCAP